MLDRIRMLLEAKQLTPTQFADAIGVARPVVSHVLSGRNKPSLDVVQRILGAMPDVSMPWLLNGAGPMVASAAMASAPDSQPVPLAPVPAAAPVPASFPAPVVLPPSVDVPTKRVSVATPVARAARSPALPAPRRFAATVPIAAQTNAQTVQNPLEQLFSPATEVSRQLVESGAPLASSSVTPPADAGQAASFFTASDKPIRRIVIFYRDGSFADYQPEDAQIVT